MFIVLILRLSLKKTEKGPNHLLDQGYIWYDKNYGSGQSFLGYTIFDTSVNWGSYCVGRSYGSDRTVIALAPSGNAVVNAVKATIEADFAAYGLTVQLYDSRDAIMNVIGGENYEKDGNPGICFGGALVQSDSSTNTYQVNMIFDDISTERTQDSNMPNQELDAADEYQRKPNNEAFTQYKEGGYTYLQNIFANAILRDRTGSTGAYISMIYTPSKSSKYNDDDFATAAEGLWNFFILLIFLAPLYRFVSNSVAEKETKIREAMKIMGLSDAPYWLSWFAYYILINTIQCIVMLIILLPVFEYSNKFLVFLYLWLYGMTMFGYGLFVGAFFSSGKTAAIVATMFFYLTSFINTVIASSTISEAAKTGCSFFPAVAVQLAGTNLLEFESSGVGLTFENSNELYKNYRFGT